MVYISLEIYFVARPYTDNMCVVCGATIWPLCVSHKNYSILKYEMVFGHLFDIPDVWVGVIFLSIVVKFFFVEFMIYFAKNEFTVFVTLHVNDFGPKKQNFWTFLKIYNYEIRICRNSGLLFYKMVKISLAINFTGTTLTDNRYVTRNYLFALMRSSQILFNF